MNTGLSSFSSCFLIFTEIGSINSARFQVKETKPIAAFSRWAATGSSRQLPSFFYIDVTREWHQTSAKQTTSAPQTSSNWIQGPSAVRVRTCHESGGGSERWRHRDQVGTTEVKQRETGLNISVKITKTMAQEINLHARFITYTCTSIPVPEIASLIMRR